MHLPLRSSLIKVDWKVLYNSSRYHSKATYIKCNIHVQLKILAGIKFGSWAPI